MPSPRPLPRPGTGTPTEDRPASTRLSGPAAGLGVCVVLAVGATAFGGVVPLAGAPVIGVVAGVVVATAVPRRIRKCWSAGVRIASTWGLQVAVVLLGVQVSVTDVVGAGRQALPVTVGTLAVCLLAAALLGRALGVDRDLRTLIGVGTAVCGASAIAAVTPIVRPAPSRLAYALTTVFVFNVAAVIAFPLLGRGLGMDAETFGILAGTAVNDTSSVVAAAEAYGDGATHTAVVVKLVRTLAIIPICLVLSVLVTRRPAGVDGARPSLWRLVPWFLIGFALVVGANSAGLIPGAAQPPLAHASSFLITTALAGIGLTTDLSGIRRAGARPLLFGGLLWGVVTLAAVALLGTVGAS